MRGPELDPQSSHIRAGHGQETLTSMFLRNGGGDEDTWKLAGQHGDQCRNQMTKAPTSNKTEGEDRHMMSVSCMFLDTHTHTEACRHAHTHNTKEKEKTYHTR